MDDSTLQFGFYLFGIYFPLGGDNSLKTWPKVRH